MPFALDSLGQVALTVGDVDEAEAFYGEVLGLRRLYRFGSLVFFDCAGVRLMLSGSDADASDADASDADGAGARGGPLYFRVADLRHAVVELEQRGVYFVQAPARVAVMDDHELWMAFFEDPSGNLLALMHEATREPTSFRE